jgi:hypothetical protein
MRTTRPKVGCNNIQNLSPLTLPLTFMELQWSLPVDRALLGGDGAVRGSVAEDRRAEYAIELRPVVDAARLTNRVLRVPFVPPAACRSGAGHRPTPARRRLPRWSMPTAPPSVDGQAHGRLTRRSRPYECPKDHQRREGE